MLDILLYTDERLKAVSTPVPQMCDEVKQFVQVMFETLREQKGFGLAAPQVGLSRRIVVMEYDGIPKVLINPEIVEQSGRRWMSKEGCLSFPDMFGNIWRPQKIKVKAKDIDWNDIEFEAEFMEARIILHEFDHLDGILFLERMEKGDREKIEKRCQQRLEK